MYAVTFDLDIERLQDNYPNVYNDAYKDIRDFLKRKGFEWKQGSVCFGHSEMNAVRCVLAIRELSEEYQWFKNSVRDIRMLRIEENNDLMEAL